MIQFDASIGDILHFPFAINDSAGSGADGATPTCDVRLAGAAADAAPTASPTPELLTHANYSNGSYEVAINTTGWAEGQYFVYAGITVDEATPSSVIGGFRLRAAGASLYEVVTALTSAVAGLTVDVDEQAIADAVALALGDISATVDPAPIVAAVIAGLTPASATIASPVVVIGDTINLVIGDDYVSADGVSRTVGINIDNLPRDYTAMTVKWLCCGLKLPVTATALDADTQRFVVDLHGADTSLLRPGQSAYSLEAIDPQTGRRDTFATGTVHAVKQAGV